MAGCPPEEDGYMLFYGECIRPMYKSLGGLADDQYNITKPEGVKMAAALKSGQQIEVKITVTTEGKKYEQPFYSVVSLIAHRRVANLQQLQKTYSSTTN